MEAKAACELLEEIESVAVSRQLYSSIFYDNRGKETFELKISSDEASCKVSGLIWGFAPIPSKLTLA